MVHGVMRRYVNCFQPSFKLVAKTRNGSAVIQRYSPPATPCDRVMRHGADSADAKAILAKRRATLDPVALLHAIRETQSAWRPSCPLNSGPRHGARAWNAFGPGCPTSGARSKSKSTGNRGRERRAPGERGRIPSKVCGATCWAGCRKTRTPERWHCWGDCQRRNRIDSAGLTCVRYSAGCSSGAASWPKSWSTPRLVSPGRNLLQCRN